MEGSARFAIVSLRAASGEAPSREKNNDSSKFKFCRNIVYVSSIARNFSFHFLHVLPNLVASKVKGGDKPAGLSRACVSHFKVLPLRL